jgi:hypothetical protein
MTGKGLPKGEIPLFDKEGIGEILKEFLYLYEFGVN